ncbi:tail protein X [Bosea sp. 2KB_26]|uniref:tail protein X n=1 Tax=Bosea sp. 2KB_26 TaxID=3237475 RepID=UPI003F909208
MRVQVRKDGMTLDLVVWQALDRLDPGVVEAVLALNPGIADLGAVLPVGTFVELPEPQAPQPRLRETVVLWS